MDANRSNFGAAPQPAGYAGRVAEKSTKADAPPANYFGAGGLRDLQPIETTDLYRAGGRRLRNAAAAGAPYNADHRMHLPATSSRRARRP